MGLVPVGPLGVGLGMSHAAALGLTNYTYQPTKLHVVSSPKVVANLQNRILKIEIRVVRLSLTLVRRKENEEVCMELMLDLA